MAATDVESNEKFDLGAWLSTLKPEYEQYAEVLQAHQYGLLELANAEVNDLTDPPLKIPRAHARVIIKQASSGQADQQAGGGSGGSGEQALLTINLDEIRQEYEEKRDKDLAKQELEHGRERLEWEKERLQIERRHFEEKQNWLRVTQDDDDEDEMRFRKSSRKSTGAQRLMTMASNFSLAKTDDKVPLMSKERASKPRKWGMLAWSIVLFIGLCTPGVIGLIVQWSAQVIYWLFVGAFAVFTLIITVLKCVICTDSYLESASWDCCDCCACCESTLLWWSGCCLECAWC